MNKTDKASPDLFILWQKEKVTKATNDFINSSKIYYKRPPQLLPLNAVYYQNNCTLKIFLDYLHWSMNSALEFFHYPFVFCDKRIYDLFHNEVWSQLFLFQIRSCHGIKMANTLRKKKRKNGYKYTSELKMITMHAGEHRRVLILVKKITIFDVETPVSIFPNLRWRAR